MKQSPTGALGWGVFASCSWLWSIGMFLPLLLLRDWGWTGFLVFAIPNVLGTLLFGLVVTPDGCRRIQAEHGHAVIGFSIVTVVFQLFFIGMIMRLVGLDLSDSVLVMLAAYGAAIGLSVMPTRSWPWIAGCLYVFSFIVLLVPPAGGLDVAGSAGRLDTSLIYWAIPTFIFGFMLCPVLDGTFHEARERGGSMAFVVFAIAFSLLLIGTALLFDGALLVLARVACIHMVLQAIFTSAAHARATRQVPMIPGTTGHHLSGLLLGLAPLIAWLIMVLPWTFESVYLGFMIFYGLFFPAYVILLIHPSWWPVPMAIARNRGLISWTIACLVGIPLYQMGFMGKMTWLLPIPLMMILSLALLDMNNRGRQRDATMEPSSTP